MTTPEQHEKNMRVELEIMGETLQLSDDELDWELQFWSSTFPFGAGIRLAAWKEREGKPYQASIEKYVSRLSKEPRDFCNDWNMVYLMEKELYETGLEEGGLERRYLDALLSASEQSGDCLSWQCRHPKSPEFCVDAALAALDAVAAQGKAGEAS